MKKQEPNSSISNDNQDILVHFTFNEPKIKVAWLKKKKHRQDTIAWMICTFSCLFFGLVSLLRFTVVGQFLDDYLFTMLFGWFKYFIYLFMFFTTFLWISAKRIRMNFKFLLRLILFILVLFAIGHTILLFSYLPTNKYGIDYYKTDMFTKVVNAFLSTVKSNSVINYYQNHTSTWFMSGHGYIYWEMGTGIIGAVLASLCAYVSLFLSLILLFGLTIFIAIWMFTGNFFYVLYPSKKRQAKAVRILKMKNKDNPNKVFEPIEEEIISIEQDSNLEQKLISHEELAKQFLIEEKSLPIETPIEEKNIFQSENVNKWDELNLFNDNFGNHDEVDETFIFNFDQEPIRNAPISSSPIAPIAPIVPIKESFEPEVEQLDNIEIFQPKLEVEQPFISKQQLNNLRNQPISSVTSEILDEATLLEINDDDFFGKLYGSEQNGQHKPKKFQMIKGYKLPPIDLLKKINQDSEQVIRNADVAQQKANAIDETFKTFNIDARVINKIVGPSVTKFEIQPGFATKVNSITSLENDLKLALATQSIRIEAPIQGKNLVGIEIANSNPTMVSMREIVEQISPDQKDDKLLFVLGKNVFGEPMYAELNKMPHLLVAGSTGSGKSVMINAMICSILLRAKPDEVRFLMIDPKKVELSIYSEVPHMLSPVISDMKKASRALDTIVEEMINRYSIFEKMNVKNIQGYNNKVAIKEEKMPFIVVIIDELADLMMTGDRKSVEESIMRITQMARAAGIHLVLATQRPSTDVITGTIKSNIPTRIAFAVTTGGDSRTILDSVGAENLIGRGDMLYSPPGGSQLLRSQGAYLSDDEIEKIVNFCSSQQKATYSEEFISSVEKEPSFGFGAGASGQKDELYDQIKNYVITTQDASSSSFKRKFRISYDRAMNIMDQLEYENIVGPKNGTKPREVLVQSEYEYDYE